jgi:hypothetical protein
MTTLEIENLQQFATDVLLDKASKANDRIDIESLKEVAECCGLIDLATEIEQIWGARKVEIQNDLNDTVNMHIELIRGC